MSAAVNREASRNVIRKASQMTDKASFDQRNASAAIESGDDFSRYSTQALDNYDNFDQTIMNMEASQVEDPVRQAPQPEDPTRRMYKLEVSIFSSLLQLLLTDLWTGASTEETCTQCITPLTLNL